MLNRAVVGYFMSKIEVKSSKSVCRGNFYSCLSIRFFTFEQCIDVPKVFLPSFEAVRRSWRDFFAKE